MRVEPLEGDHVGPPIYLRDRMKAAQLDAYAIALRAVRVRVTALAGRVKNVEKLALVGRCLDNALADVAAVRALKTE